MRLTISREGHRFMVDDISRPGSPPVGYGKTMTEAIGAFFHANQTDLGIEFDVHPSAAPAEKRRRARELSRR